MKLYGVVRAILENCELFAGFREFVFEGEAAVLLRFFAIVEAGVEVFDGVLGFFKVRLEGGNPLGFGVERFLRGGKLGGSAVKGGLADGGCLESFQLGLEGFVRGL